MIDQIPDQWRSVRFRDVLSMGVRNGIYKPKEFHGRGAKIVNMGELFAHPRMRAVSMRRIEVDESELDRFGLDEMDLLFARRSLVAEGAGKCSIVLEIDEPTVFESSIIRARPSTEQADPVFLYYLWSSPIGTHLLGTIRRQVAVAGITGKDLEQLEIPVPPLDEQRAVAGVLDTLDNKIEQNRRTAQTLELLARAIFRAWFVDFEPVKAKQSGATSFPSMAQEVFEHLPTRFTDSELGPIPEGWEVKPLGDLCDVNARSMRKGEIGGEIEYVNISSVTRGHLDEIERMDFADAPSRARRLIQNGDTIWSCVRPNRMSYLYIHDPPENRIVSTGFAVLTPKKIGPSFLYQTDYATRVRRLPRR